MNSYSSYTIERGEIFWISPGDFERGGENTIRSDRPAIIVSNDEINTKAFNYEVVFLTTKPKKDEKTHVTIRSSNKTSTALCEQITTVSAEQIGKYIGTCTDEEMDMIDTCLQLSLGLETPVPASYTTSASTMVEPEPEEDEEWDDKDEEIYRLQEELTRARTEADILRKMYNELLDKTLQR